MDWNWELVAGPYNATTEGPCWDGTGLLFSCIPKNQILRYDPEKNDVTEFRRFTNGANGLAFGPNGALYGCQSLSRRMVRFNKDGSTTPLPWLLDGKYHNRPNDVVVDSKVRVWFSDPYEYGRNAPTRGPQPHPLVDHGSILRLEPPTNVGQAPPPAHPAAGWTLVRVTHDTLNRNGLALSPDEKTLYVAETSLEAAGIRQLRAYPINEDGTVGEHRVLHDFGVGDVNGRARGVDGMTVDAEGSILACAGRLGGGPGPMVYVFSPTGRILDTHPIPADRPTNCCFAGRELTELYLTTIGGHLFRVRETGHKGFQRWPA